MLLSVYLGVIMLCGMFYSDALSSEIRLKEELLEFDKNIVHVSVHLEASDDEITNANIFIESREEITNEDELMRLASESINLDTENIDILSMEIETG